MRQPASYHGGLGLSLLGQRVRPAPPPRRGGPLLREPFLISPSTRTSSTSVKVQPHRCHLASKDTKVNPSLRLKVITIGEDIDSDSLVGRQLMKIREADTVQQLQRLLQASALCVDEEGEDAGPIRTRKERSDDVVDNVDNVYETCFLVHHTTLRDAIARAVDSEAVT